MKIKNKLRVFYKTISRKATEKEMWQIAIRKRSGNTLYHGNGKGFRLIRNSIRYWRADPFLYEKDGINYLFAELYDRFTDKGVIAVSKVNNKGRVGKFRVCLDLPFHLSYPCLVEKDKQLYMIPECRQSGEISLFRCVDFPLKWEKESILCVTTGVDTTPIPMELSGNDNTFITTINTEKDHNNNLYIICGKNCTPVLVKYDDTCVRSGGHFINDEGKWLRVVQDDTEFYGCRLVFNQVISLSENRIDEEEFFIAVPPNRPSKDKEISISLNNPKKEKDYVGIHTYNSSDKYEVIDLVRHNSKSFKVWIANTIKQMKKSN